MLPCVTTTTAIRTLSEWEGVGVMVGGVDGDGRIDMMLSSPSPSLRYGMHEDYDYYVNCKLRQRNMGLFTADQVAYSSPPETGGEGEVR